MVRKITYCKLSEWGRDDISCGHAVIIIDEEGKKESIDLQVKRPEIGDEHWELKRYQAKWNVPESFVEKGWETLENIKSKEGKIQQKIEIPWVEKEYLVLYCMDRDRWIWLTGSAFEQAKRKKQNQEYLYEEAKKEITNRIENERKTVDDTMVFEGNRDTFLESEKSVSWNGLNENTAPKEALKPHLEEQWKQKEQPKMEEEQPSVKEKSLIMIDLDQMNTERYSSENMIEKRMVDYETQKIPESVDGQKESRNENQRETKFEQMKKRYGVIYPFDRNTEAVSFVPACIHRVSDEYRSLEENSFLLHGFYQYRHILLIKMGMQSRNMRSEKERGERYFLGVPGILCKQQRAVAEMFGFPEFMESRYGNEGSHARGRAGGFGYFLREIRIE